MRQLDERPAIDAGLTQTHALRGVNRRHPLIDTPDDFNRLLSRRQRQYQLAATGANRAQLAVDIDTLQNGAFRQRDRMIDATATTETQPQLIVRRPRSGRNHKIRAIDRQRLPDQRFWPLNGQRKFLARPGAEGEIGIVSCFHRHRRNALSLDMPQGRGNKHPVFDPSVILRRKQGQLRTLRQTGTPAQAFRLRAKVHQHLAILDIDPGGRHRFAGQQGNLRQRRYAKGRVATHGGFYTPYQIENQASLYAQERWQGRRLSTAAGLHPARQLQGIPHPGVIREPRHIPIVGFDIHLPWLARQWQLQDIASRQLTVQFDAMTTGWRQQPQAAFRIALNVGRLAVK